MIYLEFPYCEGGNLDQWLDERVGKGKDGPPPPPWELQAIGRQLLCAVMYLHERGVIHKDIKPGNILVHADGRVLLSDFDLSRDTTSPMMTSLSHRAGGGTLGYLAPEIQVLPSITGGFTNLVGFAHPIHQVEKDG